MTSRLVRVGSRSSPLSLAQTDQVLSKLRVKFPDRRFVLQHISTTGDSNKDAPLLTMEKGMFVKEIELALLRGEIDLAVHSAKDLTVDLPEGLTLAAVAQREDPRDVLVDRWGLGLAALPVGARVGTSSPRRTALIMASRPDIKVLPIRGNVGTRLEKSRGDDYDGVVLAAAGLSRLGRLSEVSEYLAPDQFTPEVGQGSLAVQTRSDDRDTIEMVREIDDGPSHIALKAERAFLSAMGGGCSVPVTAYAQSAEDKLGISSVAALPDGSRVFRAAFDGDSDDPGSAGKTVAERLLEAGAKEIVDGF